MSAMQQSDSVTRVYIIFHILFHDDLSQDIEHSSLCYTVGTCLSILYILVYVCWSKPPVHPPNPFPTGSHSLLSM